MWPENGESKNISIGTNFYNPQYISKIKVSFHALDDFHKFNSLDQKIKGSQLDGDALNSPIMCMVWRTERRNYKNSVGNYPAFLQEAVSIAWTCDPIIITLLVTPTHYTNIHMSGCGILQPSVSIFLLLLSSFSFKIDPN